MVRTDPPSSRRAAPRVDVTFVVVPRFPLLALGARLDVLRVANRESAREAFAWRIASDGGGPVVSSSGVAVDAHTPLAAVTQTTVAIVLAAYEPERAITPALLRWLRAQDRRGRILGCVDTAALVLARAGLLGVHGASVHPEVVASFREDFQTQICLERPWAFEGRRLSSAGGVHTLDMALALVERMEGAALANRVAAVMGHVRVPAPVASAAEADPGLARCLALMRSHVEDPLTLRDLSACADVPEWTMRRLFRRRFGTTPSAHYQAIRLEHARRLLAYSRQSVNEIALACGFADTASLSHAFRRRYGAPPSRSRHDPSGAPQG